MGDHEIVTDTKYCGNGSLMRINGGGSIIPTIIRYVSTKVEVEKVYREVLQMHQGTIPIC